MELLGYIAAVLIGISLGLIGGGGSILTVPVLVYLFGIDAEKAIPYSLFIVGMTSVFGTISYFKNGWVDLNKALLFGIPSIIMVLVARRYILPVIPDEIFRFSTFVLTKNTLLMLLFAITMLVAAKSMIRKRKEEAISNEMEATNYIAIISKGAMVGLLTGFIGAGGGFLIIPALVNFLKLSMKTAVGTSLLIIAANSLLGFVFSMSYTEISWSFISTIAAIAIVGIIIGSMLVTKIDNKKLKPAFGYFILLMGSYVLLKELFF